MKGAREHQLEERIFDEALKLSLVERPAFLARICGGDPGLMLRVEELLREHEAPANALDHSPGQQLIAEMTAAKSESAGEGLASNAGRYLLGEKLGEGGWGAVYAAEQQYPVRRSVAIKIIKLGMDTRAVVARFQAEQQALALMDHPNIAKVFDAGETSTGRPFFAMERVRGTRITEYCDRERLTILARLRLFGHVCRAIQHAHQKGIVHRDLKPSNILVSDTENPPQPKVIDFGIAKATHGRLGDATLVTERDAFMGTPAYVSPEQAANQWGDIDTRTDIYSLGVMLHELLTGTTPLDAGELRNLGTDETRRRICRVESHRPSLRLRTTESTRLAAIAAHRQVEPRVLIASLAGDLDWIVLRCLEKDRTRRYESVGALATDLEHHLKHEPVVARPPSRAYLLKKLVRRNRLAFAAIAAIALVLAAGITASTALLLRERAARVRAVAAEEAQANARRRAENEQRKALTEAERSEQVSRLLMDMLMGIETSRMPGRDTTLLLEILAKSENRVSAQLRNQPEVQADLQRMLGWLYFRLGNLARAETVQRAALKQQRDLYGNEHPKVAECLSELGLVLSQTPTEPARAEAENVLREATAILRKDPAGETLALPRALGGLATILDARGEFPEAIAAQREALAVTRRLDPGPGGIAPRLLGLGRILMHAGDFKAAVSAAEEVLELFQRHRLESDPESYRTIAQELLAELLSESGQPARAEALIREALAHRRELHNDSPQVGSDLGWLSRALRAQGRMVEAANVAREAVTFWRGWTQREPTNLVRARRLIDACNWLGVVLQDSGRTKEAKVAWEEGTALSAALPGGYPGDPDRTEAQLRETLTHRKQLENDLQAGLHLAALCRLLRTQGRMVEAESVARETVAFWRRWMQREPANELHTRRLASACDLLGAVLREMGQPQEANAAWAEAKSLLAGLPDPALKN